MYLAWTSVFLLNMILIMLIVASIPVASEAIMINKKNKNLGVVWSISSNGEYLITKIYQYD